MTNQTTPPPKKTVPANSRFTFYVSRLTPYLSLLPTPVRAGDPTFTDSFQYLGISWSQAVALGDFWVMTQTWLTRSCRGSHCLLGWPRYGLMYLEKIDLRGAIYDDGTRCPETVRQGQVVSFQCCCIVDNIA